MSSLHCPDCPGYLHAEHDDAGELIGFECDNCHTLFDDAVVDEDEDDD